EGATVVTIDEIRDECVEFGIGDKFWSVLIEVTRRVARARTYEVVAVYNHGLEWSAEAFDDLAQEVVLERLLPKDQEQLQYVLTQAKSDDELRRLLSVQVKRVLNRRRGTHTSDRLLARVRKLAETDGYAVWKTLGNEWIAESEIGEPHPLNESE